MSGTVTPDLPVASTARSVAEPKIRGSLITLRDALNAVLTSSNTLDGAQIGAATIPNTALATSLALPDSKLASPNNSVYKTLIRTEGHAATHTAGTYWFNDNTDAQLGINDGTTATPGNLPRGIFDYASGEYTAGALTTKFRVKMEVLVGATSPSSVTFTAGLYPLTISSGNYHLGTVVTGSTALSSGLATNTISRFNSGDFAASALLADPGDYVLGVVIGSITVPAGIAVAAQLQTRNV